MEEVKDYINERLLEMEDEIEKSIEQGGTLDAFTNGRYDAYQELLMKIEDIQEQEKEEEYKAEAYEFLDYGWES